MYKWTGSGPQFLLVHPGGPYWSRKDDGAWSIPKGLYEEGEDPLDAAKREFHEETGCVVPDGDFIMLGDFKQPGGKNVLAWAVEGDFDIARFRSNLFSIEWPPKSGRIEKFPEVDRAGWFPAPEASRMILKGQLPLLNLLLKRLAVRT
jgi:predicted NUDIX family NTP pyrophosphohydrolase